MPPHADLEQANPMSTPQPSQDPLQPVLHETAVELKEHLREACEAEGQDVESESTDELRELEDSLLAAAVAVQQTITLRRHVQKREAAAAAATAGREQADGTESGSPPKGDASEGAAETTGSPTSEPVQVREFQDQGGRPWRAWSVTPGLRPGRDAKRYLGEFHGGWLCFEALDGSARRRLPRYPAGWVSLEEQQLDHLLQNAIDAPERKLGKEGKASKAGKDASGEAAPPAS